MKNKLFILAVLYCAVTFGQVTRVDLAMSRQDLQSLLTRDLFKTQFLPVNLNIAGSTYGDSRIRYKGNTSRLYPKKGLRIKLGKSTAKPPQFGGMSKMNFNPMFTDKSFMREKLVWDIFRMMDGLGPKEYGYANVFINGVSNGLYLMIQHVDEELLKDNSRPPGDIYEAGYDEPIGNLSLPADGNLKRCYEKHEGDENDYSALKDLIDKLNNTSDADFSSVVRELFDMKSVYDFYVLNIITMQADTDDKNYYLYRDPSKQSQMWSIIPWDYDMSFGRDGEPKAPYPLDLLNDYFAYTYEPLAGQSNVLKDRLLKDPVLLDELKQRLSEVLQNVFNEDKLYPIIDETSNQIDELAKNDPGKWGTYKDFKDQKEALKYFITARRNFILSTFLNPKSGQNDVVTLDVSSTGILYNFVDYDGVLVASMNFTSMNGLQRITVRAHPSATAPGLNNETSINRFVEIIPFPANATFTASLRWGYLESTDLTEVGSKVFNEGRLQSVNYSNGSWQRLDSYENPYGNYAQIEYVNESNTGQGRYFALTFPDVNPGSKVKNAFWHCWHDAVVWDEQNVIAAGDDGTVILTNDGGMNWRQVFVGSHVRQNTIARLSSGAFVAGGMYGFMFRSVNGGASWSAVNSGITSNINKVEFRGETGWAACDNGTILFSADGGIKWTASQVSSRNICALKSLNEKDIIAGDDQGATYKTDDGGRSWYNMIMHAPFKINNFAQDGKNLVAVCDRGVILFSTDGGVMNSNEIYTGDDRNLLTAAFIDNSHFYAGGENGAFYSVTDGKILAPAYMGYSNDIHSLIFTSSGQGFAFCNSGVVLRFH